MWVALRDCSFYALPEGSLEMQIPCGRWKPSAWPLSPNVYSSKYLSSWTSLRDISSTNFLKFSCLEVFLVGSKLNPWVSLQILVGNSVDYEIEERGGESAGANLKGHWVTSACPGLRFGGRIVRFGQPLSSIRGFSPDSRVRYGAFSPAFLPHRMLGWPVCKRPCGCLAPDPRALRNVVVGLAFVGG